MKTEFFDLGNEGSLSCYLWDDSPELSVKKRPGILIIPGGGYSFCSDREAEPVAYAYLAEGFNAFVLRYGCNQSFSLPFSQAEAAMGIIKNNSSKWGIGKGQLVACGFSAGGHLACSLGCMSDNKPDALILVYPALSSETWGCLRGSSIPGLLDKIDQTIPPSFVTACFDDSTVPVKDSLDYVSLLNQRKVPFECHIFSKGEHGFSLAKRHTASKLPATVNQEIAIWFEMSVSWIKRTVGDVAFSPVKETVIKAFSN